MISLCTINCQKGRRQLVIVRTTEFHTIALDGHSKKVKDFINAAKARQESYHWRLKTYTVLSGRFRHGKSTDEKMAMHKMCTEAVCVIVKYDLMHNPLMHLMGKIKAE